MVTHVVLMPQASQVLVFALVLSVASWVWVKVTDS